jgi:two-component system CheB/CheR fusion protein
MQSLIEQKEASNEELQAANEEIQSSNEELQSVNEELQTSKEEIQSSNEELATVNDELRQRNADLDRNMNDLANFVGGTNLAVIMVDNDLRIRRFTPQAERQLKLIASDVGRSIEDIKLPFDVPRFGNVLSEVIDTVTTREFEVQDKEERWHYLRVRPYKTIDKKIDGALLVLVDIDSLKKSEHDLRTSEERYRLLVEGAEGIAMIALDEGGRVTNWNVGAQRVFGYHEAEIVGRSASRFFIPQDQAAGRLEKEIHEAAGGHPAEDDNWLVRKDGSQFWASGAMTAIRDERGRLRGFTKIVRDASERRRQEVALRASEERFRALFERAAVGIEQVAQDGRILVANQHLCELLGYTAEELQALNIRDIVHPDDQAEVLDLSRQLFAGEIENQTLIKRLLRKDGNVVWALTSSTIVPGEAEGPRCRISVIQDISARKAAEEALTEAGQRKDQFLATLAHELRNPLAPLRTMLEVFRREVDAETLNRGREVMARQISKIVHLVDLHRGRVEVRSDGLGQGSEFIVTLPLSKSQNAPIPTATKRGEQKQSKVSCRRVLVVDDNGDAATGLARLLTMAGHEVRVAHAGPAGLEIARQFRPEVVLLDIGLPGMDGYAVAAEMRKRPETAQAVLAAVSGYGHAEAQRRSKAAGFDARLLKPVEYNAINDVIARVAQT